MLNPRTNNLKSFSRPNQNLHYTALRTYLPSGKWTQFWVSMHSVIKMHVCTILRCANTMAKPQFKYTRALAKANKKADSCNFDGISVALQRGCFTKKRFNSILCSAEVIRTSSWLICYCMEKSNWTHKHNQLCNPTVHVCQGLINCETLGWEV